MLAANATTALPAAPAAPETKSAAARAALWDKPPNQFCSAVPTICTSCSAVAVSMPNVFCTQTSRPRMVSSYAPSRPAKVVTLCTSCGTTSAASSASAPKNSA